LPETNSRQQTTLAVDSSAKSKQLGADLANGADVAPAATRASLTPRRAVCAESAPAVTGESREEGAADCAKTDGVKRQLDQIRAGTPDILCDPGKKT